MGLNMYLASQKQSIAANVAVQNKLQKENPNSSKFADTSSSDISIFSDMIRNEIRNKALKCNDISSQVIYNRAKNQASVSNSVSKVNDNVSDFEAFLSWANSASKELAEIPGITSSALDAIKQNMASTMRFGTSAMSSSVSQAREALTKINMPNNNPFVATVEKVQNRLNTVTENTIQTTQQVQTEVTAQAPIPVTGKTETGETANTAPAAEAPKTEAPKTETKAAEAPKTDEPKAETTDKEKETVK